MDESIERDPVRAGCRRVCGILMVRAMLIVLSEKFRLRKILHQLFRLHSDNVCCIMQDILSENSETLRMVAVGQDWDGWISGTSSG